MNFNRTLYELLTSMVTEDDKIMFEHEVESICAEGQRPNLNGASLRSLNLQRVRFENVDLREAVFDNVELQHCLFIGCDLTGAVFKNMNLEQVRFERSTLCDASFVEVRRINRVDFSGSDLRRLNTSAMNMYGMIFKDANLTRLDIRHWTATPTEEEDRTPDFSGAILSDVKFPNNVALWDVSFSKSELKGTDLSGMHLHTADFSYANLWATNFAGSQCTHANLCGADLYETDFRDANFQYAVVDGFTSIRRILFNQITDFRGVPLESAKIQPGYRAALSGIVRKKIWRNWYQEGGRLSRFFKKTFVRLFWVCSDYGCSTGRLALSFILFSLAFAVLYFCCTSCEIPVIANLSAVDVPIECHIASHGVHRCDSAAVVELPPLLVLLRAVYFSVVTMTTLGFGDMSAYPLTWYGHVIVMIQVLIGYLILGALVTRLGILFTGDGPISSVSSRDRQNTGHRLPEETPSRQ